MAKNDYSDEDEYYSQKFEEDGVVSIWIGLADNQNDSGDLDVLQDLCGVGYYDLSSQEGNCFDFKMSPLKELLTEMSYSESFIDKALEVASEKGLQDAHWVTLQYDFDYDLQKVSRAIADDPIYLGSFAYADN